MTVDLKNINIQSQETFAGVGETSNDSLYFVEAVVITSTYHDGMSWRRTYSDGWCEQGGQVSAVEVDTEVAVPLHTSFKDTNYTVTVTPYGTYSTGDVPSGIVVSKSTGNFHLTNSGSAQQSFMWEAKGYIS